MRRSGRTVVVTGSGVVSPLGDSLEALSEALAEGRSGISEIGSFDTSELDRHRGGEIRGFDPRTYLGDQNFRPLDRTGRLVTVAAKLALENGGLGTEGPENGERGLVLGTMFGSLHTICAFDRRALEAGPRYAKPLDFANSVINAAAGQAAIWHHLTGINATIGGGTTAGLQALGYGADQIRTGRSDKVLAGGAEELCAESLLGFVQGGFLAHGDGVGSGVPFHPGSDGFLPGEGAALLLLETREGARARGGRVLAEIRGHATVFDSSRGRDPEERSRAVVRAVEAALARAGTPMDGIDFVSASANGHPAIDGAEARGLERALGESFREMPVLAVKALLGETLGASGAFQVLAALGVFATGQLPGVPGLEGIEGDPLLPGVRSGARSLSGKVALVTAVGLDGPVSALVLAGGENGERGR